MKGKICGFVLLWSILFTIQLSAQEYQEVFRPQYHFSPVKNWINDPCGMVYLDGEYHLMYQYNPWGTQWGNMSWGHAVSKDMIHWEELPVALYPDNLGAIFSGGAVIDYHNTAGFGDSALVALYTSASHDQKQSIAYSTDKGRSWKKYAGNPVLPNQGTVDFRDPMVFWHDQTSKWIMALAVLDRIEFYSSPNLKDWIYESEFGRNVGAHGGVWECPDLFQLTSEKTGEKVWALMVSINPGSPSGGSGTQYFLGNFDGKSFTLTPEFDSLLSKETTLPAGVLFEGFEDPDYAGWQVTGDAFGSSPAQGTLANQQPVTGYIGSGLVNTYLNGDATQGKITSGEFIIEHDFINFLIGGGNHPDLAEIRLIVEGKKIISSTGRNQEKLIWNAWNTSAHKGKTAFIEVVDSVTGGWGHINIDHIYFSNDSIKNDQLEALWVDYGPDFYAGRSFENQPQDKYQRVWMAWMNNWSYAGNIPTTTWRGSMSLPRKINVEPNANGQLRIFQNVIGEVDTLINSTISYQNLNVSQLNQKIISEGISGLHYVLDITIDPGTTTANSGIDIRKGSTGNTRVGYDPKRNAVFIDRTIAGYIFSGSYDKIFYAPLENKHDQIQLKIFVDDSSVEVFVNGGQTVLTARIFPQPEWDQISFFGSEDVNISSFNYSKLNSIWHSNLVLANHKDNFQDVILYPNPTKDNIFIKSKVNVETAQLVDSTGRVQETSIINTSGEVRISTGSFEPGLYLLHIKLQNGEVVVKKVLIN